QMTTTYAILLRGVNIGKRKVKSAELKSCFTDAGYANVQTVLATGNIILESEEKPKALRQNVEKLLWQTFDFRVKVGLVTQEQLAQIIKDCPFSQQKDYHRYVLFADQMIDLNKAAVADELETVKAGKGVIYWQVKKGFTLRSKFSKSSSKLLKHTFSTTRNINTLEKILKK